jgi:hypothetical protein
MTGQQTTTQPEQNDGLAGRLEIFVMSFDLSEDTEYQVFMLRPGWERAKRWISTQSQIDAEEERRLLLSMDQYKDCDIRIARITKNVNWL